MPTSDALLAGRGAGPLSKLGDLVSAWSEKKIAHKQNIKLSTISKNAHGVQTSAKANHSQQWSQAWA